MTIKKIFMIMSILLTAQVVICTVIRVENLASFPIAIQSLEKATEWTILQPKQNLHLKHSKLTKLPGITWKQHAGDKGNLPGCVYYFASVDQRKYVLSFSPSITIFASGVYKTNMNLAGGGQAKLFTTDENCKSFGSDLLK